MTDTGALTRPPLQRPRHVAVVRPNDPRTPASAPFTVRPARTEDRPAAIALLTEAFLEDPTYRDVPPDPRIRRAALQRLFTHAVAGATWDSIDVASTPSGDLIGVAVWEQPHPPLWHRIGRVLRTPMLALGLLRTVGGAAARRWLRAERASRLLRPLHPHWYLSHLAVSTTARGQGVGSALLTARLQHVDTAGALTYLEATTNASQQLYQRHGFTVETRIPHAAGAVAMIRCPHRSNSPAELQQRQQMPR